MKRLGRYIGLVSGLATVLAAGPLFAQQGPQGFGPGRPGAGGPHMGHSLVLALEHVEDLGLTQDQATRLQELKTSLDEDVAPLAEEMEALRETIRAGDVDWEEGFRQIEALRGQIITASAPLRGRVLEILTVEQHTQLQSLLRQERPGVAGRRPLLGTGRGRSGPAGAFPFRGTGGRMGGIAPFAGPGGGVGLRPGILQQGRNPAMGIRGRVMRGPLGWGGTFSEGP